MIISVERVRQGIWHVLRQEWHTEILQGNVGIDGTITSKWIFKKYYEGRA